MYQACQACIGHVGSLHANMEYSIVAIATFLFTLSSALCFVVVFGVCIVHIVCLDQVIVQDNNDPSVNVNCPLTTRNLLSHDNHYASIT